MNAVFHEFAGKHFGTQIDLVQAVCEFLCSLLSITFSHRHSKNADIMPEGVDFKTVRDPMYKYSKKSQDKFLCTPLLAFFVKWFIQSEKGRTFALDRLLTKG